MTNEERDDLKRTLDKNISEMVRLFEKKTGLKFDGVKYYADERVGEYAGLVYIETEFKL